MSQLKSQITVSVDDRDAQQSLDRLIEKLTRAVDLAQRINIGGAQGQGGPGTGPVAPAPGAPPSPGGNPGGAPGAQFDDYRAGVQGNVLDRSIRGVGSGMMMATQGFTSGRSDPSFAVKVGGRLIERVMDSIADGVLRAAEAMPTGGATPVLSEAAGIARFGAVTAKILTHVVSEGVMARYEQVGKLASVERPSEVARVTGGLGGGVTPGTAMGDAMTLGAQYGMTAQETASILASYGRSIGQANGINLAGGARIPLIAAASGLSPEMIARFASLGTRGGGAVENVAGMGDLIPQTLGILQQPGVSGLRGAKVDEALARISAATTQMAEQGMFLDIGATTSMMNTLMRTGAAFQEAGRSDVNVFGGMHGVRGALRLSQTGARAAGDFRGNFGQLGTMALQASAFQGASSPMDALRRMEETARDPEAVRSAITGILGPGMASELAFAGAGFSASQAGLLADPSFEIAAGRVAMPAGTLGGARPGNLALSSQMATDELNLMRQEASNDSAALLEGIQAVTATLINFGTAAEGYLDKVNDLLGQIQRNTNVFAGGAP